MSVVAAGTPRSYRARSRVATTRTTRSRRRAERSRGRVPPEHGAHREPTPTIEGLASLDRAGLIADLPGVDVLTLPHRAELEAGLGESLDGIRVLGGPLVAEALDARGAEGAALGDRVFLRDDRAPLDTVAHEVVHVVQARAPGIDVAAGSPAEAEAERVARAITAGESSSAVPEIRAALDPGQAALRSTAVEADPAEQKQRLRDAQGDEPAASETEQETTVTTAEPANETEAESADAEPASPTAEEETPQPTFEPPPMPDTALSPEEQAARQAELAAAEAAIEQASTGSGVVGAFADAPPSVKASAQATLGSRVQEVVAAEERTFQDELPELKAEMGGELQAEAVPPVQAPEPHDVSLEDGTPPPAPDPEIEPTPQAEPYRANDAVAAQVSRLFGGDPASAVGESLGAVSTKDPDIEASPGPPPAVPREGENDPARLEAQRDEAGRQAAGERDTATQAVLDGPGPERARLRQLEESYAVGELQQPEVAGVTPADGATELSQMALPEEVLVRFDEDQHASMQESVAEACGQVEEAERSRDEEREAELASTEAEREALVEKADADQRTEVLNARTAIQKERQATIEQQDQAVRDLEADAESRRTDDRGLIEERVEKDERAIRDTYAEKEQQAQAKIDQGELDAKEAKRKAERDAENESWWDKAVNFVKEAFAALTSLIGTIFDKVRAAVTTLIDAAKDFAKGVIDLAAGFIKKTIAAFGEALKGLVTVLLADTFPGLARRLNEAIDGAVELASKAVDAVADTLKAGVEALAGALKDGLNKILDVFQGAIDFALGALEAVLTGDWSGLARKVLEAVLRVLGIEPAEFYALIGEALDTLKVIVDAPGKFIGHLIDAVVLGFQKFADNFLTHLKAGVIKWLTGALGDIQIPEKFDLAGVLDLGRQILGITWDWIKKKAAKVIGEKNVERLEFIFSYVETLREGGFAALFERIKGELTGLAESILGQIKEFLVTKLILAGIKWLASLFSPVGAVIKLVLTIWNFIQFLREQLARMIEVAKAVISGIADIARGVIEAAGARVEQVLGNLLPIAIDLVAKLLGLTGVSKKVREVIGTIREKFDAAVDKLIAKVLAKFKGKKGEKGADEEGKAGDAAGEIPVGDVVTVPVPDGDPHRLSIDVEGTDAVPVMRSKELPVTRWLADLKPRIDAIEDVESRDRATKAWKAAGALLAELDPLADTHLARGREAVEQHEPIPDDRPVDVKQAALGSALTTVFAALGGTRGALAEIFAERIERCDPTVQIGLRNALERNADAWATLTWDQVREQLPGASDIFGKPLLGGHAFGRSWRGKAMPLVEKHRELVPQNEEADFLTYGLVRPVHMGEESPYRELLVALRAVQFGDTANASMELATAVGAAAKDWSQRDKTGPDADLKEAAGGQVVNLLKAVARQEKTFRGLHLHDWDTRLWGLKHNREWIKGQFRGRGGQHEWIPTNYVADVVERARTAASASDEGLKTATRWIDFQDAFRSPTNLLIFDPNVTEYRRTVDRRLDPETGQRDKVGSFTVLQGHIGAVYAPVDSGGYRDSVTGQTKNQGPWHDKLRGIFDAARGIASSREGMEKILDEVENFADRTLWLGGEIPGAGFEEYYAAAQGSTNPADQIGFATLRTRAASAKQDIDKNFDTAAKAAGF